MFAYGKFLFRINLVQLILIGMCLGGAILARYLAIELDHVSLTNFISTSFENIFNANSEYGFLKNLVIPGLLYILSGMILFWMGVVNLVTFLQEEKRFDQSLRAILGILQVVLFGWFIFTGGKLLLYYAVFAFLLLILIAAIVSGLSSGKNK